MPDTETRPVRANREAAVRLNREVFIAACACLAANTDEERARLFGTSRRAVTRYLNGESDPLLTTARRYAATLNVPLAELWPAA